MEKRLLIAGFETWGPYTSNPAAEIAKELHDSEIKEMKIHGIQLPIDFASFRSTLSEKIAEIKPTIVYGIGMDFKDVDVMNVELEARQIARYGEFSDSKGNQGGVVVLDDSFGKLTVPNKNHLERIIASTRLPVKLSMNAGQHMCETVLRDLIRTSENGRRFMPGFIHVPHTPDQLPDSLRFAEHKYSMPLKKQIEVVRNFFEELLAVLD